MTDNTYTDDLESSEDLLPTSIDAPVTKEEDVVEEDAGLIPEAKKDEEVQQHNDASEKTTAESSDDESGDEPKTSNEELIIDAPDIVYEETKEVCGTRKETPTQQMSVPLTTYMQGPGVTHTFHAINQVETDPDVTQFFNPYFLLSQANLSKGNWHQTIKHKDKTIGPRSPRIRATGDNDEHVAVTQLRRHIDAGIELTFELAHTGIVVTMTPVNEDRIIDLDFTLSGKTNAVGLQTSGMLLSSRSAIFARELVELAIAHITSTNLKVPAGADIRETLMDVIDPLDYQVLVWGLQSSRSPSGYPWVYRCSTGTCTHEHEGTLNFSRALWYNRAGLTDKQLDMLTSVSKGVTLDDLKEYQDEFPELEEATIELSSGVKIVLGRTSMRKYLAFGDSWCQEIEKQYNDALRLHATENTRAQFLRSTIQAKRMARYGHLVKSIIIPNGEDETIWTSDTEKGAKIIRRLLCELSSNTIDYDDFESGVMNYIDMSTVAMVGYPAMECPKCKALPKTKSGNLRSLVPIPIDRVFFTLVQQKVLQMAEMAAM